MKKRTLFSIIFLCIIAVIFSACNSSKPPEVSTPEPQPFIAQIKINSGSAEYQTGNSANFVPATDGTGVLVGDRVRSEPGAQIAVEFLDGSSLVLLEGTEIEIQKCEVTRQGESIVTRVARVAVFNGDVSGDVREDLVYPPSVFEIVTAGEIYTIKGTLSQ